MTDGREKYCWFSQSGLELLFDLEEDPNGTPQSRGGKAPSGLHSAETAAGELAGRRKIRTEQRPPHRCAPRPSLPWAGTGKGTER
jgi:hypothetical protein